MSGQQSVRLQVVRSAVILFFVELEENYRTRRCGYSVTLPEFCRSIIHCGYI